MFFYKNWSLQSQLHSTFMDVQTHSTYNNIVKLYMVTLVCISVSIICHHHKTVKLKELTVSFIWKQSTIQGNLRQHWACTIHYGSYKVQALQLILFKIMCSTHFFFGSIWYSVRLRAPGLLHCRSQIPIILLLLVWLHSSIAFST